MDIKYKGRDISINEALLDSMHAWANLHEIMETRIKLLDLFDLAENLDRHNQLTKENCADILSGVTECDYALQELWGFEKDSDFHTYTWELPFCTCPTMDNLERVGTNSGYIISESCPYHSKRIIK